jgi:DNA-binding IclR family transcriptional regulator
VNVAAFPLIDRTKTLVAALAVMGRHERVNPRDGAEMIAFLKRATFLANNRCVYRASF